MVPNFARPRSAALAFIACAAMIVAGCGTDITPTAIPEQDSVASSQQSTSAPSTPSQDPAREGEDLGGDVDIDVEIGDCVRLGGTQANATIDDAECGSAESNFVVIAKAPSQEECPTDIDQSYYVTVGGIEQGALCLDVDWVVGGCIDLGSELPQRIECPDASAAEPLTDSYLITDIWADTIDVERCPDPATGGFRYPERNFIVCFEEL
ncbi:MAG: hypothetical protein WBB62_05370 [Rhodococcus sp. (in: high G+C Gram-positive bacteria)]